MKYIKSAWSWYAATKFHRVVAALWRIKFILMPKWMIPVFAVCLFIPGPLDEFLAIIIVGIRVLCKPELRRIVMTVIRAA
jgi:hypothetical protein